MRKKAEIRNPNPEAWKQPSGFISHSCVRGTMGAKELPFVGLRTSDFGLLSDFGPRPSDFPSISLMLEV
jgi:hypothetical protein